MDKSEKVSLDVKILFDLIEVDTKYRESDLSKTEPASDALNNRNGHR